jgi:hypothetical protein
VICSSCCEFMTSVVGRSSSGFAMRLKYPCIYRICPVVAITCKLHVECVLSTSQASRIPILNMHNIQLLHLDTMEHPHLPSLAAKPYKDHSKIGTYIHSQQIRRCIPKLPHPRIKPNRTSTTTTEPMQISLDTKGIVLQYVFTALYL